LAEYNKEILGVAMERTIIVVVGLIGAGKSETSGYIESLGIPMFRTGDVIRKAVLDRGMELTPKNSEMMARKLREEHGMDYPARKTGERIEKSKAGLICVEGPRDMAEISYLSTLGEVRLLVVTAPIDVRYERSRSRKAANELEPKSRDPKDFEEFKWRDEKERERGQDDVISTDKYTKYVIENTGTKEELYEKIRGIIAEIKGG